MYEMKTTSFYDPTEFDQHELCKLFEMVFAKQDLLTNQFNEEQLGSIGRIVEWISDPAMQESFDNIQSIMAVNEQNWNGAITNIGLEREAASIKISVLAINDIWMVATDCLNEVSIEVNSG